jgi:PKD repeat protein
METAIFFVNSYLNQNPSNMKLKFTILFSALLFSFFVKSQCNVGFFQSYGSNGHVLFSDSTAGLSGMAMKYWNFGYQGFTATGDTASFSYPYNGTYTVTLTIADSLTNCFSSTTGQVYISNSQNPGPCSAAFTYSLDSAGLVHFTNTSILDSNFTAYYTWHFGDGGISYVEDPSYSYYYNGTYTVSLNISSPGANCFTSTTDTITISNTAGVPPCTATFTNSAGANGNILFTSAYTGNTQYQSWNMGDGYSASTMYDTIQHTYQYNGAYIVTHTIADSLANCFVSFTDTIIIANTTPCGPPTTTVYLYPDSFQISVWYAYANYDPQVVSAIWFWGDGTSDAGFAPTHTYGGPGWYTVCVLTMNSCGDSLLTCVTDSLYHNAQMISLEVQNPLSTGIANVGESFGASLFPNPSDGQFFVSMQGLKDESTTWIIQLYSFSGQLVDSSRINAAGKKQFISMNYSQLKSGIYFLKISNGEQSFMRSISISN